MRIIAGRFRGRQLRAFPGGEIRPTSDRLRETLFNILQSDLAGASVWDAFAGTGALGLEALSRGASRVVFTETDPKAAALVRYNVESLQVQTEVEIVPSDALDWSCRTEGRFDLIFIDPPYRFQGYRELLEIIGSRPLCTPSGIVVVEHFKKSEWWSRPLAGATATPLIPSSPTPSVPPPYRQVRQGDSMLSFFQAKSLMQCSESEGPIPKSP